MPALARRLRDNLPTWLGGMVFVCLGFACTSVPLLVATHSANDWNQPLHALQYFLTLVMLQAIFGTLTFINLVPAVILGFVSRRPWYARPAVGFVCGAIIVAVLWIFRGQKLYLI